MLNLKQALAEDIAVGIKTAFPDVKDIPVVVKGTEKPEHGDYASPVALGLAKQLKKKPMEVVEAIVKTMPKKEYIGRLAAAEPGFLNIFISPGWMQARLDDVLEQDIGADFTLGKGKSVNLEFISANPTGPMTMGNARPAFAADTLANVLERVGYNVTREYYVNDAGEQVRKLGESVLRRILQAQDEKIDFPEELYQGEYIKDLAATIAERYQETEGRKFSVSDLENAQTVDKISQEAMQQLHGENVRTTKEVLGVDMDVWTSESTLREGGAVDKVVEELRQRGATYTKDRAEWLAASKFGHDKDVVLVKKDGNYAYFAPDIAYNQNKYERGYEKIFTYLGADHLDHYPRVLAAMRALGHDVGRWQYFIVQFFRLMRGGKPVKLSKRRGEIATPKDLIDEVGYDAARFFFLQHDLKSHMDFDLDLAKERSEKNPVYYVQYAYVRLQSILRRAKEQGVITSVGEVIELSSHAALTQTGEVNLMRHMYRLPEVVDDIAQNFAVQQLTVYAYELAYTVHFFYKHVPVLTSEELVYHRLQLVLAARKVLGEVLDLLGISKPDVM